MGEKPFVCTSDPDCGTTFAQAGDLVRHKRTHTAALDPHQAQALSYVKVGLTTAKRDECTLVDMVTDVSKLGKDNIVCTICLDKFDRAHILQELLLR